MNKKIKLEFFTIQKKLIIRGDNLLLERIEDLKKNFALVKFKIFYIVWGFKIKNEYIFNWFYEIIILKITNLFCTKSERLESLMSIKCMKYQK